MGNKKKLKVSTLPSPWPAFSSKNSHWMSLLERERESDDWFVARESESESCLFPETSSPREKLKFWQKLTVMLAWMVCFRPEGSTNLQVSSSTEAETTWSLVWFRGNADSNVRISLLRTFMQAILPTILSFSGALKSLPLVQFNFETRIEHKWRKYSLIFIVKPSWNFFGELWPD